MVYISLKKKEEIPTKSVISTELSYYGINKFIKNLNNQGGPANSNRYITFIYPIAGINNFFNLYGVNDYYRALSFLCINTNLLGKTISTSEAKVYGPMEKFPYETLYEELQMEFLCTDKHFNERRFFDAWMDHIVNPISHNINYKDQYISKIDIFQLNQQNEIIYGQRVHEAFPTAVAEQTLDWDSADTEQRLSVTFTYRNWEPIIFN